MYSTVFANSNSNSIHHVTSVNIPCVPHIVIVHIVGVYTGTTLFCVVHLVRFMPACLAPSDETNVCACDCECFHILRLSRCLREREWGDSVLYAMSWWEALCPLLYSDVLPWWGLPEWVCSVDGRLTRLVWRTLLNSPASLLAVSIPHLPTLAEQIKAFRSLLSSGPLPFHME